MDIANAVVDATAQVGAWLLKPAGLALRPMRIAAEPVRRVGANAVLAKLEDPHFPVERYLEDEGDPGLVGPDSAPWHVHSDVGAMLIGGLSALMLQALDPLALAGVFEYSNFREDPIGRLQRTGRFVAATTFASARLANENIDYVKRLHSTVRGKTPDGRTFDATDPAQLRWVHVAEVDSFLRANKVYGEEPLGRERDDSYFEAIAVVAEKLGATFVPKSRAEVDDYYAEMRPRLAVSDITRETLSFIMNSGTDNPAERPLYRAMTLSAYALLPEWAQRLYGYRVPYPVSRLVVEPAANVAASVVRWSLGGSKAVENSEIRLGLTGV